MSDTPTAEAGVVEPPAKIDPRYYIEGASWEHDVARRNRNSRALAWIVAGVMTIVAVGSLGALALLVPLKTYEPYMVVVDRASGFVEVKRPMAEGPLTQDEAVTTFNVVRYIKARETYDPRALKDNFDLAQLLATGDAARELTEIYSPANPQNPVKIYGSNTEVTVSVKSVTFPNNRTALVRFSTDEKTATSITTRNWVSLVRFRYTSAPMRNEYRFDNPLGFQVLEYRRDQETAPSPGTAGAQRS
ncbi:virB8 family protein [Ancylobacter dichloromethanicus]|uniref:Type IV secretion system protein virB8 n=1 Tax=Ancylobacter dichloromethanicus TaxID=518825 RepID=A0A9W6MX75_9HYPH|nr:virB8 family protein [Ancylobacter dichloromethanicus]MBS7556024.1 virB8 family protein [Ancylobacter dichloromethanicus]GLK70254.1 type VI secretion protein [Ancylobacter dichloromethanicus]